MTAENDSNIAEIARRLARAMMSRALTRNADDTKDVAIVSTELCLAVRQEKE